MGTNAQILGMVVDSIEVAAILFGRFDSSFFAMQGFNLMESGSSLY